MKVSIEKINEAKALLGDAAAKIIADGIPLEGFTETATSICAFSPFRHETKPSFMWNKKEYYFKDFGNGKVVGILDYFIIYESKSYSEAVKALFELVGMEYSERDFEVQEEASKWICVPDEEPNDRAIVEDYLAKRCISKETLDFCSVKQAENGDIAYQFKDQDGKLVTTKYRVSHKATNKDFMKWRWKKGFTNPPLLYGLDKIDITRPVLITEGLNDRLACVEAGFMNTVSIPGGAADMSWVDTNYEFLEKLESIIIWSDSDEPGRKMAKNCAMRLGQYRVKIVEPNPDIQEEIRKYYAQYGADEYKIDANNVLIACGKDAVLAMIASAKITDNPFVSRLMDAEEKDIMSLPRTSTGIEDIDRVFWGTFEGQLVLLTGQAASGKSTLINTMFVAAPLEAGEKVFIYSGEINPGMLLGNVLKPLASRRHILEFHNDNAPNGYSVSKEAVKSMKKFYYDSVFVYNEENDFDTNSKSIMDAMSYAYKRYGVTNFVVDSLLTVDCSKEDGENRYDKEASFVKKLKVFTNKNPVKVCLVIHSRKLPQGAADIGADDIQGSSTHVKACNRAFSVNRLYNDPEGYDVVLTCLKDRETGLLNKKVKLHYDNKSFRLYSNDEERDKAYSWEKCSKINYPDNVAEKIVANIHEEELVPTGIFG